MGTSTKMLCFAGVVCFVLAVVVPGSALAAGAGYQPKTDGGGIHYWGTQADIGTPTPAIVSPNHPGTIKTCVSMEQWSTQYQVWLYARAGWIMLPAWTTPKTYWEYTDKTNTYHYDYLSDQTWNFSRNGKISYEVDGIWKIYAGLESANIIRQQRTD